MTALLIVLLCIGAYVAVGFALAMRFTPEIAARHSSGVVGYRHPSIKVGPIYRDDRRGEELYRRRVKAGQRSLMFLWPVTAFEIALDRKADRSDPKVIERQAVRIADLERELGIR